MPSSVPSALALFIKYGGRRNLNLGTSLVNPSSSLSNSSDGIAVLLLLPVRLILRPSLDSDILGDDEVIEGEKRVSPGGYLNTSSIVLVSASVNAFRSKGSFMTSSGNRSNSPNRLATASTSLEKTKLATEQTSPSRTVSGIVASRPKSK